VGRSAPGIAVLLFALAATWTTASVTAAEEEEAPDLPDRVLVLMGAEDAHTREATTIQLRGQLGEDVQLSWMLSDALSETWARETFEIRGPGYDMCSGDSVDPKWVNENGELALHLVDRKSTGDALSKALEVEAGWACLDSVVTPTSLLRTALIRAWVALLERDADALDAALKQAAALNTDAPESWVELMPADLWETLADYQFEIQHQSRWEIVVDTDGLAIDAFVDGVALPAERLDGSARRFEALVPPGEHLLQIVRPGPRAESAVLHLGPDGGSVRVSAITPVTQIEALDAFDRGVMDEAPPLLLQDLFAAHTSARSHDHIVLAHTVRAFGAERLVLVPIVRTRIGSYIKDESLERALAVKIDRTTRNTRFIRREKGPPGAWRLWFGGGAGVARIQGYTYAIPSVEVGVETPHWISAFVRPSLAITREEFTFVQGGVAAVAAFTPRVKRLRFVVGIGGELRGPDHRFDGPGIHPIAHGGIGIRIGDAFHLTVSADVALYLVRDVGVRLTFTREVGTKKARGFEILQKEEEP